MNPKLLRRILMWVAPFVIGAIMKRYEERHARKQQDRALSRRNS